MKKTAITMRGESRRVRLRDIFLVAIVILGIRGFSGAFNGRRTPVGDLDPDREAQAIFHGSQFLTRFDKSHPQIGLKTKRSPDMTFAGDLNALNPLVPSPRLKSTTSELSLPLDIGGRAAISTLSENASQTRAKASSRQFVQTKGTHLVFKGRPFYFIGANCYYLMTYAADPARRAEVDEVLQNASQMGLKVVRTWAFNDGKGYNALQTAPGVYDEHVFKGLDYVVWKAEQLGLRLILVFVNNWDDYGGMNQYVEWSPTARSHDDFYTDENAKKWFRDFVSAVLTRTNTFSGKLYKDDPTIMVWELANEPRASRFTHHNLIQWMTEMSRYIKTLDPNHLVATGTEGMESFVEIHQIPTIDICTVHLWPDQWHWDQKRSITWLRDCIHGAHEIVHKPLILEEFGKYRDTTPAVAAPPKPSVGVGHTNSRDQLYQAILNVMYENRAAGALFWILYHNTYPDYDGFGVYYPTDLSTVGVLRAAIVRAKAMMSGDVHQGTPPKSRKGIQR